MLTKNLNINSGQYFFVFKIKTNNTIFSKFLQKIWKIDENLGKHSDYNYWKKQR